MNSKQMQLAMLVGALGMAGGHPFTGRGHGKRVPVRGQDRDPTRDADKIKSGEDKRAKKAAKRAKQAARHAAAQQALADTQGLGEPGHPPPDGETT